MHFDRNEWQLISKTQTSLELNIPDVDLTGKMCNWWSTDTATHQTISGIFSKQMTQSHFNNQEPWTNYYNFVPGQYS